MNANVAAPGPVGGTERVPVVWRNRTVHMEYQWIAAERSDAPLVVFLHEGLGSVAMWKDFPRQLCDAGGLRGLVFSRPAYGRSTPRDADEVWGPDFMHQQAHEVVPAFLDALGVQEAAWLFGHSDGASIALLMAARWPQRVQGLVVMAPHLFVEDVAAMPQAILDLVRDGDVVLTMGAGSIGGVPGKLVQG